MLGKRKARKLACSTRMSSIAKMRSSSKLEARAVPEVGVPTGIRAIGMKESYPSVGAKG